MDTKRMTFLASKGSTPPSSLEEAETEKSDIQTFIKEIDAQLADETRKVGRTIEQYAGWRGLLMSKRFYLLRRLKMLQAFIRDNATAVLLTRLEDKLRTRSNPASAALLSAITAYTAAQQ